MEFQALTISPDGLHLYAASETESAVTLFSRNTGTGELTWEAVYKDGVGGNEYLAGAYDAAVSPDGKHVYVASYLDNAITVFLRNATTGLLTRLYVVQDGGFDPPWLQGASALLVSPDNNQLYVTVRGKNTLTVFHRDTSTGGLTWAIHYIDGQNGVDGLQGARGIAIDPAGEASLRRQPVRARAGLLPAQPGHRFVELRAGVQRQHSRHRRVDDRGRRHSQPGWQVYLRLWLWGRRRGGLPLGLPITPAGDIETIG